MQKSGFLGFWRQFSLVFAALTLAAAPAYADIQTIDPDDVIGSDSAPTNNPQPVPDSAPTDEAPVLDGIPTDGLPDETPSDNTGTTGEGDDTGVPAAQVDDETSYQEDDLIGAAEGVFGKGASGLAGIIENILKKQGKPNGYIVGREAGGAFVVGLRYGSGTLHHKVEGERPVYWTGPSIGFDAGANAGSTFVLVYNLYDTEDLYKRFASAEGVAYLVGGFNASYMRKGDVVLIPIRVGAGLRLGANVGYMKMSKKRRLIPF